MILSSFLATLTLLVVLSPAAESAMAALLGVVGTYIIQFIKTRLTLSGRGAMVLSIAVSAILGIGVAVFVGEWDTNDIFQSISTVLALATVAYRFFVAGETE